MFTTLFTRRGIPCALSNENNNHVIMNNNNKYFDYYKNNIMIQQQREQGKQKDDVNVIAISPDNKDDTINNNEEKKAVKVDDKDWDEGNGARYAGYSARAARVLAVFSKTAKASTRYIAYSSDVGEASRPLVSQHFVRAMYGVAFAYVGYDVYSASNKAINEAKASNKSDDEIQQAAMRAGTETLYFQLLASIIVPSLIIHTAVHKSQDAVKNVANVTLKRYGPTALGLGIIPLLPFTIDEPIEHFVEYTFNMVWPHEDHHISHDDDGDKDKKTK